MRRYALRDDQWDRIKDLLPGREGSVGVTARTIGCSSRRCSTVIVLAFPGATCRSASGTGRTSTGASAAGPNPVSGSGSFSISRPMPTTNTR